MADIEVNPPRVGRGADKVYATPVFVVNETGPLGGRSFTLADADNGGLVATVPGVSGGRYAWRAEATSWGDTTARLEYRSLNRNVATWFPVRTADGLSDVVLTANGQVEVRAGQNAEVRVALYRTGSVGNAAVAPTTPATGFYSNLAASEA